MSLSSVMGYVRDQLDGLTSPNVEAATAYVAPPVPGEADPGYPQLFVWTERMHERRVGAPRGQGLKRGDHDVQIYVLLVDDPSSPTAATAFPDLLEKILSTLRGIALPATLTDPDTGLTSHLSEIGEEFTVVTDAVRALKDERFVRYLAVITAKALETFTA